MTQEVLTLTQAQMSSVTEDPRKDVETNSGEETRIMASVQYPPVKLKEAIKAATAENYAEVMQEILAHDSTIEITKDVISEAARNEECGKRIMEFLLADVSKTTVSQSSLVPIVKYFDKGITEQYLTRCPTIEITEAVLTAAASNDQCGHEIMELLLARDPSIEITEAVLTAAASNDWRGHKVMKLLLARDSNIEITNNILRAAAGNSHWKEVIGLLVNQVPNLEITEDIVAAANGPPWKEVMEFLFAEEEEREITQSTTEWPKITLAFDANIQPRMRPRGQFKATGRMVLDGARARGVLDSELSNDGVHYEHCICINGWRIPDYYHALPNKDLGNETTITKIGDASFLAKSAADFLKDEYQLLGPQLLELIGDLCAKIIQITKDSQEVITTDEQIHLDDTSNAKVLRIRFEASHNNLSVSIEDLTKSFAADVSGCIRWICAAFVPRSDRCGIYESRLRQLESDSSKTFTLELVPFGSPAENGCWTNMFEFAYIITDTPHPLRHNIPIGSGLTIDFQMLVALSAVEREILSEDGIYLVGFDTALVPIEPVESRRWHFVLRPNKQLTSRDIASLKLSRVSGDEYSRGLVTVGWCPDSKVVLGTRSMKVNTNISTTQKAQGKKIRAETSRGIQLQFGAQGGVLGSALVGNIAYSFQSTRREAAIVAVRSPADNFIGVITQASSKRVILFDSDAKVAWVVPEVAVLLHASLCLIEANQYQLFEDANYCGMTTRKTVYTEHNLYLTSTHK